MKRCARCVMPDTAMGITLDQDGLCPLCKQHKSFTPKGLDALKQELAPYVDNGRPHNCLVPVSGGRDSSYALYVAKELLGLRPIAYHNDNDFETNAAQANLEAITRSTQTPLVRTSSAENLGRKIVAEKFMMNAPFGPGLVAEQTCEACGYGFEAGGKNTARREGIKVIIWGDSQEENTDPYHELIDHVKPSKKDRLLSSGALNFLKYKYLWKKMQHEYGPDDATGIKEIHLYDYIEWDRRVIVDTIQNKMGWKKPEDSPTSWRIDCHLVPLVNFLTKKAYGVSKIELGFSNMIRSGKMEREDAIEQLQEIEKYTSVTQLEDFLKHNGVSVSCIRRVLY